MHSKEVGLLSTFFFNNGATANNVEDLHAILTGLDDDVFSYHCNKEKNDFHTWLSDVHPEAASAIKRVKTRKSMVTKLKQFA